MATVGLLIAIPALTTWLNDQLVNTFGFGIPRSWRRHPGRAAVRASGRARRSTGSCPATSRSTPTSSSVFVTAVVVAVGLWLLMRHTPLGLQMRAVVDRADLAEHPRHQRAHHVALRLGDRHDAGGARRRRRRADHRLARSRPASSPSTFVAAAAAVLGGLRSIPLAFLGGLLLGVAENLVVGYVDFAQGHQRLQQRGAVHPAAGRSRGDGPRPKPPGRFGRRRGAATRLPGRPALWRRALPWTLATAFLIVYILFLGQRLLGRA